MRLRDNDVGLIWDRTLKAQRTASPIRVVSRAALPESNWLPPAEFPSLAGVKRISFDLETRDEELFTKGPGVRRPDCYVVGWGVGTDDGRRWYFPTRHEGGGNLDEAVVLRWLREELNAFRGTVTGAKLDYDLDWAAEHGITFPLVEGFDDVQIAEPLLDEWRYEFSLNALAQDYLKETKREDLLQQGGAIYGWKDNTEIKRNLWRLPANLVGPYAEGDLDLPLRIFELQKPKLEVEGLGVIYSIERRLIPILVAMRRRGVRVDMGRAEHVKDQLTLVRDGALARVRAIAGPKAELMAPDSFAHAFQEQPPLTSKTKRASVTKGWLNSHKLDPLAAAILEGRSVDSLINTFIDGHIFTHAINGRIHAQFNQLKGESGGTIARLSSSLPNMQNLPARDEELAPLIRGLFLPEESEIFYRLDFSQIEYRLLTHFAIGPGADEARRKYNDDPQTDFHKFCAQMMGLDPNDSRGRKRTKGVNFCKVYGGGIAKIAAVIGCSFEEAEEFTDLYDRELPFVKATLEAAMKWAQKQGYVTDILGRRQRFPLWEPRDNRDRSKPPLLYEKALSAYGPHIKRYKTYAALNRKNQASSATITKKSMVDTWEAGIQGVLGAPLISVHDEMDLSAPNTKEGREAAQEYKRLMEVTVTLKVPILVDCEIGPNWGAVE